MITKRKKRAVQNPDEIAVAVLQCELNQRHELNVARVIGHIRDAAEEGATLVVTPEMFESPYFPRTQDHDYFEWARPLEGNKTIARFCKLAKELGVVIPYSFFEIAGPCYYNSVAMIDANGKVLGVYRKSHIPTGPGYQEKYYFREGDTGFRVWDTKQGKIGVGICWDQWFPECARAMALMGAEILLYPSAIGSEPESGESTKDPWQRVMIGHAVASSIPVAAANRIGEEGALTFYGSSFICDPRGDKVEELGSDEGGFAVHVFNRPALRKRRAAWGFFRDRRPEHYDILLSADGTRRPRPLRKKR